jgi:predicted dehydrogenase
MEEKPINVGIVGLGDIARVHASILRDHPAFRLVGGADISEPARTRFETEYGVDTFTTVDDLLRVVDPDVVFVCVPNKFHAETAIRVLESGAFCLCEKPPAMNAAEAVRMAKVAAAKLPLLRHRFPKATANLLYGLVYRHTLEQVMPFFEQHQIGPVPFASARWVRRRGVPGRGVFTDLAMSGGGSLMDLGTHVLDAAMYALRLKNPLWVGARTSRELAQTTGVHGYGYYDPSKVEVEDTAIVVVQFAETLLLLNASFAANVPGGEEESVRLYAQGTTLGIEHPLHTGNRKPYDLVTRVASEQNNLLLDSGVVARTITVQEGYIRQVDHIADVLLNGQQPIVTPGEGVALMEILDGAYKSAETGEPVLFSAA